MLEDTPRSAVGLEEIASGACTLHEEVTRLERALRAPESLAERRALAWQVDGLLLQLSRGRGAVELGLGEGLSELARGHRVRALGLSRVVDLSRERYGLGEKHCWSLVQRQVQMYSSGERTLFVDEELLPFFTEAILAAKAEARASGAGVLGTGAALARIAHHFIVERWPYVRAVLYQRSPVERQVILEANGQCEAPECNAIGAEVHHIQYRSRGGGEGRQNLVLLCWRCHHRVIHEGHLVIEGRSGRRGSRLRFVQAPGSRHERAWVQEEHRTPRLVRAA